VTAIYAAPTFDRVAEKAATLRPLRVLLSVLAAPFYGFGWLVGVLWVAVAWAVAAVVIGVNDARRRGD
jgi:hypothetical protein